MVDTYVAWARSWKSRSGALLAAFRAEPQTVQRPFWPGSLIEIPRAYTHRPLSKLDCTVKSADYGYRAWHVTPLLPVCLISLVAQA
jgi:hypothetical protein